MQELAQFYAGKRVLLTGGTGFKGSWLCLLLEALGASVYDYSLEPPSTPSLWEMAQIGQTVQHKRADILHRETMQSFMMQVQPDITIHLAAQALVRPSYETPYETFETNVMGTASVLDAILATPSSKANIIITSDKAYENINKPYPYVEDDRMGGHDPYSASKGCAELVVSAYRRSFFDVKTKGLASVRAGNVIGGGDFAKDRLIPDMVRAFVNNEAVHIRYPHATRPWQHVLDPLVGYLMLAKKLYQKPEEYSEAWNFGPLHNEAHTVEEVVGIFSKHWGKGANYCVDNTNHPHEATFLGLDCHKAHTRLHWSPRLSFEEGVRLTAGWYKQWHTESSALASCKSQIAEFLRL